MAYVLAEERKKITDYTGGLTVSELWDRNAKEYSGRTAIEDPDSALTWAEAALWIDRLALGLVELGFERDDTLVVQLPNSIELHLLRVAGEKAGIRVVPVTSNMRRTELEHILGRTEAAGMVVPLTYRGFNFIDMITEIRPGLPALKHLFVVGDGAPEGAISIREMAGRPLEKNYPADYLEERRYRGGELSLIGHTSGSTGLPKLTMYSPDICSGAGRHFMESLRLTPEDTVAAIAPAARGPNLPVYFSAPWAASKIFMLPWSGPEAALELIQERKITVACLVPTQLALMIEEAQKRKYDLSSIRVWESAGAFLPPPLMAEVEEKMGGTVLNNYGSMELGNMTSARLDDPHEVRMNTAGKPIYGVEIKVLDDEGVEVEKGQVGEIKARCLCASLGFYQDEAATREIWDEQGWASMGDLGMIDSRGDLVIVGRKKDMIIRGGQNIYPVEIENLLLTHPKVSNIALVKMPDPVMGEKACAFVVPKKGGDFTIEEMASFLSEKGIAPYKTPERLEIIDTLPLMADGQKVDKNVLERDIEEKLRT